jgi:hypothetical protein
MSSRVQKLLASYRKHLSVPWQVGLAPVQRVIFAIYDKTDELRLRATIEEFELATRQADKRWRLIDLTEAFPTWMAAQEYRDAYFECPEDLDGYPGGEISGFMQDLIEQLRARIRADADAETVVAVLGVGALFGLCRVSSIVEGIKDVIPGRLLVFFPGEHHPENHSYRLLDARDGWNYLAVPLMAAD